RAEVERRTRSGSDSRYWLHGCMGSTAHCDDSAAAHHPSPGTIPCAPDTRVCATPTIGEVEGQPMRLLAGLMTVALAHAATPLFHASFDKSDHGWTVVRGAGSPDTTVVRDGKRSFRVEPGAAPDACVRSAAVTLTIGKRYELSGWVRTEALTVRDLDRSPIATGAALTMASMPFDVHSASLGGTRNWTRVSLRFV